MPSLLEALENKYFGESPFENFTCNERATIATSADYEIFIPRLSPLALVPELLVLNDCDIDHAGEFQDAIKEKCQRVRELDLAKNKLQDWQEVCHILTHMPRIEFLNLSQNQLNGPLRSFYVPAATNLRNVVLNGTNLDWLCLNVLIDNLPQLEELHLSLNNYKEVQIDMCNEQIKDEATTTTTFKTEVAAETENANATTDMHLSETCSCTETPPPSPTPATNSNCNQTADKCIKRLNAHTALKALHFNGNPIENWQEICRLGRVFPCLQLLVLANCPIKSLNNSSNSSVTADANDNENAAHKHFGNLQTLNLSNACISSWQDIDELARFPKLQAVRMKNWPLFDTLECTEYERRQLVIARLPNVRQLNGGGIITADEREVAERAFIRHYMQKSADERPTRYQQLIAKHGQLDPLVNINLKPEKRVKVWLVYNGTSEERTLDVYCTVADLKQRLEKILTLPANKMRLYYLDQDFRDLGPELMKYPNKMLYSYNIQNGDEIIVDQK